MELASSVQAASPEYRYPADFYKLSVSWVRGCDDAYHRYAAGNLQEASSRLREASEIFDALIEWMGYFASLGGSSADVHRAVRLKTRVIEVANAIDSLGEYRPAFEVLSHPAYIAGDQAAWRTGQY
jgi:hypothetical protein